MGEQQELVTITIDGREISVPPGTLIWEAARRLGIEIPIYCYHPKMDPLGACRMCFVEVKGMPKPMTACTTTVMPNHGRLHRLADGQEEPPGYAGIPAHQSSA